LKAVAAEARAQQERRSRRLVIVLGSALLLALVVVASVLLSLQRTRAESAAETNLLVAELLERGRAHAERATTATAKDPASDQQIYWDEARNALEQASSLLRSRGAAAGEIAAVTRLCDDVMAQASRAQRSRQLVVWVERMRPHYTDDRTATDLARQYRAGFARFGFRFQSAPKET